MQSKFEDTYEESQLVLRGKFYMCDSCYAQIPEHVASEDVYEDPIIDDFHGLCSERPNPAAEYKACKCDVQNPETEEPIDRTLKVSLYIHIPPKIDGIDVDDDECLACLKSEEPSSTFSEIHMCERAIGAEP